MVEGVSVLSWLGLQLVAMEGPVSSQHKPPRSPILDVLTCTERAGERAGERGEGRGEIGEEYMYM